MKVKAIAKINRKTRQQIGWRWRFEKYNPETKRNDVVPIKQIPEHIRNSQNRSEVEAYAKSQSALEDSIKFRAEKLIEWQNEYHSFEKYVSDFTEFQKSKAPNNWQNDVYYLTHYAFGFFLSESNINNINSWHMFFEDFKNWLKSIKPMKARKEHLKINTQAKIINSLNAFLKFAHTKGWVDVLHKCPSYKREETLTVTVDDLFREEEIQPIYHALLKIRATSADLFLVLSHSPLRINEALGLCIDFLSEGNIEGAKSSKIHYGLEKYSLGNYHGFICLENQPAKDCIRITEPWTDRFNYKWETNSVPRKPLKLRKTIDSSYYRYMPIYDLNTWNILVKRANEALDQFDKRIYTSNSKDYLLFDGLTAAMFYNDLTKALEQLKLKHRSPHKTRHTYLTWLYDKISEDTFLAEKIGGHRDKRDIERYNHIREQIGRERQQQINLKKRFSLKK
jgi:integrase